MQPNTACIKLFVLLQVKSFTSRAKEQPYQDAKTFLVSVIIYVLDIQVKLGYMMGMDLNVNL